MSSAIKRIGMATTLCLITLVSAAQQTNSPQPNYITFQVPNSTGTIPTCINNWLTVAGYSNVAGNQSEGFVRDIFGNIETFKVGSLLTQAVAINDRGEIAGYYQDVSSVTRGFVRSPKGVITTFNPGGDAGNTVPTGIDNHGMVTGYYTTGFSAPPSFGFVRYPDGGIVTFNATQDTDYTAPNGINNHGSITGLYYNENFQLNGFVRSADGSLTTLQYQQWIVPKSINNNGTIAGWYSPTTPGPFQGFVRSATGKITPFALPGQIGTQYISINWPGEVTGSYTEQLNGGPGEPSQATHGFIRFPDSKILSFEVPGPDVFLTMPTDINDFGVVTGTYTPKSGVATGFLRIP
jgi:hypothetical protein